MTLKWFKRKSIENKKALIAESYGKKTDDQSFDRERTERDWTISSRNCPGEEQIDDVTWFDLEMDQIYCEINHCKSFAGDQILYSKLHMTGHREGRDDFQKKINFFESEETDRNEIWYIISGLGKSADGYYLPIFIENLEAFRIPNVKNYRLMRIAFFLSFIPAVIFMNPTYLMFPLLIGLINIVIYTFQKNRYEPYLNMLSSLLKTISAAKQIVDSPSLKYEQKFNDVDHKITELRKLYFKIEKLQYHASSSFVGDAMSLLESFIFGVTLWDLIQYDNVISRLIGLHGELKALYRLIGELDAAISVASFRQTLPVCCSPSYCKENILEGEGIFHPLVENPVYNSIGIKKGCIITGANASGKSTFIKALAINAVLGQSIGTCTAQKFVMPVCSVITSMAVRDEVSSGESYYIREIKYLKRIISALNSEIPVFCVIDEILRGTNTEERIAASASVLKYLNGQNCVAVVATHDIELTGILGSAYADFHFTELIKEKEILFEYKLCPGPATSRNAIKLLEYMEFPKEIIEEAELYMN